MSITEVLPILRGLDHDDKVLALEFLESELDQEKLAQIMPGTVYEVWSPYNCGDAAESMLAFKRAAEESEAAGNEN